MSSFSEGPLPPRGPYARHTFPGRGSANHHANTGLAILLVGALPFGVFVLTPRPDVRISSVQYFVAGCDAPASAPTVTAFVTLVNKGVAGALATVSLYLDGAFAASHDFSVLSGATVQGEITSRPQTVRATCTPSRPAISLKMASRNPGISDPQPRSASGRNRRQGAGGRPPSRNANQRLARFAFRPGFFPIASSKRRTEAD